MAAEIQTGVLNHYTSKVCPVVLRPPAVPPRPNGQTQILAFRHPLAGSQIVKGTLEPGEQPAAGALRELAEESGIDHAEVVRKLGERSFDNIGQQWHFFLCRPNKPLPASWSHYTTDGGGHIFQFFWHDLNREPDDSWHSDFKSALAFIRDNI
ncbi:MAG: NUDIX domain-containing protein [Caldilineaceae bacterium]|nr:NUDIX domain-containing protein [Caldilineaceae bacterium]MCB9157169.1 NUDIX domain-containing protein [Caldilineaceae bacterium]